MKKSDRVEMVRTILGLRAKARALYTEADELEQELIEGSTVGEKSKLSPIETAVLVDNFAEKNSVFMGHFVRQYEVKVAK